MKLDAHGIHVRLPAGWSGHVFLRPGALATLHAANFALPLHETSSFGDRTTSSMPPGGSFVGLAEYLPGPGLTPGTGLFASGRVPVPLDPTSFARDRLARPRRGQQGMQHFFTIARRPFCLYVVIAAGSHHSRRAQLVELDRLLASLRIAAR